MTVRRPLPLARQIAWAKGRAAQARRLAAVARPDSPARMHALEQAALAEAAALSLQAIDTPTSRRDVSHARLALVHDASRQGSRP